MVYSSKGLVGFLSVVGLASSTALAVSFPFVKSPGSKTATGDEDFQFKNDDELFYLATIKVQGQDFTVQIDTGSSDLWIDTTGVDTSNYIQTGQSSGVAYEDGSGAEGPVLIANVTLGEFSFSTALISAAGSNATAPGDQGLLGVGLPGISEIRNQLQNSTFNGNTVLENLFASNTSLPMFMTFQLSRSQVTSMTDGGIFSIGETDSNYSSILRAPQLQMASRDEWVVPLDGLNVNGTPVASRNKNVALLDTGTTLAEVPQAYFEAIYGSVPGAVYNKSEGSYIIPCDTKLNISFSFGGIAYPVHPIDVIAADIDENGQVYCFSAFGPSESDESTLVLGDSFLRNVYSLFAFAPETSARVGITPSYIQLLSTISIDQAFSEFDQLSSRRNASLLGNATTGSSGGGSSGNGTVTGGTHSGADAVFTTHFSMPLLAALSVGLGLLLV